LVDVIVDEKTCAWHRRPTTPDNEALDAIALAVRPWGGVWSDQDGILESIGNIVESTGRTVDWEYEGEDL
jgi:hypothetical protein